MTSLLRTAAVLVCLLVLPALARAQEDDVRAAAVAFEEGQRAQLRGDYAQAADLFEIADRSAPNPAALRSAIRNHHVAHHAARAATLSADALTRYPDDAETSALAQATLAELAPTLGRLRVQCASACSLTIDGRAASEHTSERYDVFVEPGEHTLTASWSGRSPVHRTVHPMPGSDEQLAFEPPAAVADASPDTAHDTGTGDPAHDPTHDTVEPPRSSGVHPALFGTLAGLAGLSLVGTIISGVDVLGAADAYRASPTHAGYDDGVGRELRTNVMIGVTGALAVAALVTIFFTDWDDVSDEPDVPVALRPSVYASPDGAGASLAGRF